MSFSPSFRPMKMYYEKEYHAYVSEGLYIVGKWHWTGRNAAFWKRFAPIPLSVEDRTVLYTATFASLDNKLKVWPKDPKYDPTMYTFVGSPIISTSSGIIVIKAAFKHKTTGDIVLLTGTNTLPEKERSVPSLADGWYTYTSDMVAPAIFWDILLANI